MKLLYPASFTPILGMLCFLNHQTLVVVRLEDKDTLPRLNRLTTLLQSCRLVQVTLL